MHSGVEDMNGGFFKVHKLTIHPDVFGFHAHDFSP
jgi:hypothetical protein